MSNAICLSLNEAVAELHIAAYGCINPWTGKFDGTPIIHAVLDEIFRTDGIELQPPSSMRCPSTVDILMAKGFEEFDAREIARDIYRNVLATISAYLPPVTFTQLRSYQYGLFDDVDLMITPPPLD